MCVIEVFLKECVYYGFIGLMNFGGLVGECKLEFFVLDKFVLIILWEWFEEVMLFNWFL